MTLGDIDWLLGTWQGEVEMAASPWVQAGAAAARLSFVPALDGKGIVQEYAHRGDTSTMDGHGVFMAGDDGLLWWWFDSFGFPPPAPAAGRIDEERTVVLERSSPRGTNRTTFRREGDVLHQRNEVLLPDAQDFVTVVEGRYELSADPSA